MEETSHYCCRTRWGKKAELHWCDQYYYILLKFSHSHMIMSHDWLTQLHTTITSISQFKRYHRKYLELVGEAKKSSQISAWDFDRYFWEGLHEEFRVRVEYCMLATNPSLDVSVPFRMTKIVNAAEYCHPHHIKSPSFGKAIEWPDSKTSKRGQKKRRTRSVVCSCVSQSCDIIMWLWENFSSI